MFADDDLTGLDTCAFNMVFALARALDLLIAQPAVCRDGERSYTFHDVCYAHPGYVARFSNFVEIMAPVVRWASSQMTPDQSKAETTQGWRDRQS